MHNEQMSFVVHAKPYDSINAVLLDLKLLRLGLHVTVAMLLLFNVMHVIVMQLSLQILIYT